MVRRQDRGGGAFADETGLMPSEAAGGTEDEDAGGTAYGGDAYDFGGVQAFRGGAGAGRSTDDDLYPRDQHGGGAGAAAQPRGGKTSKQPLPQLLPPGRPGAGGAGGHAIKPLQFVKQPVGGAAAEAARQAAAAAAAAQAAKVAAAAAEAANAAAGAAGGAAGDPVSTDDGGAARVPAAAAAGPAAAPARPRTPPPGPNGAGGPAGTPTNRGGAGSQHQAGVGGGKGGGAAGQGKAAAAAAAGGGGGGAAGAKRGRGQAGAALVTGAGGGTGQGLAGLLGGSTGAAAGAGAGAGPVKDVAGLRAMAEHWLQRLQADMDSGFKTSVPEELKRGEERLTALAKTHYDTVNARLADAEGALKQARDMHVKAKAEVRAVRDKEVAAAEDMRDILSSLSDLVNAANNQLDQLKKKQKLG